MQPAPIFPMGPERAGFSVVSHTPRMPVRRELLAQMNAELKQAKEQAMPSVVTVATLEKERNLLDGTEVYRPKTEGAGFVVARKGNVVVITTNKHVIEDAQTHPNYKLNVEASNMNPDGSRRKKTVFEEVQILYTSPNHDVAFVAINQIEHPEIGMPVLEMGSMRDIEATNLLMTIGAPWGFPNTTDIGHVSNDDIIAGNEDNEYILINASLRPGNSGGVAINPVGGKVVGIPTAQLSGDPSTGFMIPVDVFKEEMVNIGLTPKN